MTQIVTLIAIAALTFSVTLTACEDPKQATPTGPCSADLDGDGVVGLIDIQILLERRASDSSIQYALAQLGKVCE